MQVFLVLSQAPSGDLGSYIREVYGENSKQISDSQWLIAANDTPKGVVERLDISEGRFGKVMVMLVTQYWGWHTKEIWNWIDLKGAA